MYDEDNSFGIMSVTFSKKKAVDSCNPIKINGFNRELEEKITIFFKHAQMN